ncbi:mycofactocin system transcriptional regulator [Subtercola sp. YIM 133946]|uniref:mycofactocin system transcriptional regulator n=1 Tax=Subtercola sp. YIM 133946 TaxID=3118909 RepID=UPI002F9330FA
MPTTEQGVQAAKPRAGRQPSTTHAEISHIALTLFIERGFDAVTVDDIASAASIGRRTFFRYFASKNDLPWGDFEAQLDEMRLYLDALPRELPVIDALQQAVIHFNHLPPNEIGYHRQRMTLLLTVPSLIAHASLRYAAWRQVIAEYAASRLGLAADDLKPQAIGWALLGASLAAYEEWLRDDSSGLDELIARSYQAIGDAFGPSGDR